MSEKTNGSSTKSFSGFKIQASTASTSKKNKPIISTKKEEEEKDYIVQVAENSIESLKPKGPSGPLVIPLATNNWTKKDGDDGDKHPSTQKDEPAAAKKDAPSGEPAKGEAPIKQLTLEEKAAEELIEEIRRETGKESRKQRMFHTDKIIQLDAAAEAARDKSLPTLIANAIPGLKEIADDQERFLKDVGMRAEDMDFKSEAYRAVPVEEFGAAMLRGMGWAGPPEGDGEPAEEEPLAPRHFRLGLGAEPKPVEEDDRRRRRRKPGEAKKETNKEWHKLAKERSKAQFFRGDVVKVLEHKDHSLVGKRGIIIKTQESVPGLDNLLVELEKTGQEVVVKKQGMKVIKKEDLEQKPFVRAEKVIQDLPLQSDSEEKGKKKKKTKKSKSKKRNRSLSKEKKKVSSKKTKKDDGTKKSTPVGPAPGWLAEHIRVRVVSEDLAGGRFFRKKGVVLEVPARGRADLRMDSGARLENVRERHLETALPKAAGGRVLVLRGARRFERGALLARDLGAEVASVQLEDDMDVVQLPLDDIAEFVAGGAR